MTTKTATSKPKSFKAARESRKMPERVVTICFRGDLAAEIQTLETQLEKARIDDATSDARMGGRNKSRPLAEKIEKLRDEMRKSSADLRLRAFPSRQWRDIKRDNPLKEGDDESLVNLIVAALPKMIVSPEDAREDVGEWVADLTEGQLDELARAAIELNEGGVSVPFSRLAFATMQTSDDD